MATAVDTPSTIWISWREALQRTGSFEALRPHLREGRILARHHGLYNWPDGSHVAKSESGEIFREWWDDSREDPEAGRVILTQELDLILGTMMPDGRIIPSSGRPSRREVFALGVELEREAVERLFPAAPKQAGRKRGSKPSPVWEKIFAHFDPLVERQGKFHSLGSAASTVEAWLREDKRRVQLVHSTLKRGISKTRPDWFGA